MRKLKFIDLFAGLGEFSPDATVDQVIQRVLELTEAERSIEAVFEQMES